MKAMIGVLALLAVAVNGQAPTAAPTAPTAAPTDIVLPEWPNDPKKGDDKKADEATSKFSVVSKWTISNPATTDWSAAVGTSTALKIATDALKQAIADTLSVSSDNVKNWDPARKVEWMKAKLIVRTWKPSEKTVDWHNKRRLADTTVEIEVIFDGAPAAKAGAKTLSDLRAVLFTPGTLVISGPSTQRRDFEEKYKTFLTSLYATQGIAPAPYTFTSDPASADPGDSSLILNELTSPELFYIEFQRLKDLEADDKKKKKKENWKKGATAAAGAGGVTGAATAVTVTHVKESRDVLEHLIICIKGYTSGYGDKPGIDVEISAKRAKLVEHEMEKKIEQANTRYVNSPSGGMSVKDRIESIGLGGSESGKYETESQPHQMRSEVTVKNKIVIKKYMGDGGCASEDFGPKLNFKKNITHRVVIQEICERVRKQFKQETLKFDSDKMTLVHDAINHIVNQEDLTPTGKMTVDAVSTLVVSIDSYVDAWNEYVQKNPYKTTTTTTSDDVQPSSKGAAPVSLTNLDENLSSMDSSSYISPNELNAASKQKRKSKQEATKQEAIREDGRGIPGQFIDLLVAVIPAVGKPIDNSYNKFLAFPPLVRSGLSFVWSTTVGLALTAIYIEEIEPHVTAAHDYAIILLAGLGPIGIWLIDFAISKLMSDDVQDKAKAKMAKR